MQVHVNDAGTRLVNSEGEIAVLVSPNYGAGWYTWNRDDVDPFDPQLAQFVFEGRMREAREYAEQKWPDAYHGGLDNLIVWWAPAGALFRFEEYCHARLALYCSSRPVYNAGIIWRLA